MGSFNRSGGGHGFLRCGFAVSNMTHSTRTFASAADQKSGFKVCVSGGAGGIGQPLSMLMALDRNVSELAIQDITFAMVPASGVAADLGHIEYPCAVKGYAIDPSKPAVDQLEECMTGCDLVLVPAGIPRKPGMTRDDLFKVNCGIAKGIVDACAKYCPEAIIGLVVNPVNSVVPAMCEFHKARGLDPRKIVGVTTLDVVRANKFVAEATGKSPFDIEIPVVGGHAGATIVPLFSQDPIGATIPANKIPALDVRVQDGGTEVVLAKKGGGSATLSMAYAGARLGKAILSGLAGSPKTECAYVASSVTDLPYFASKVTFGKQGVEKVHGLGKMTKHEAARVVEASAQLKDEIQKGLDFASSD